MSSLIIHKYLLRLNYEVIGSIMNKPDQFNQFIIPPVYHSFDGNIQRINVRVNLNDKQKSYQDTRNKLLSEAANRFTHALKKMIHAQNNKAKLTCQLLPCNNSQNQQIYVCFKDEKVLRNIKVRESTDSTFPTYNFYPPVIHQYSPFSSYMPQFSQDLMMSQSLNPMMRSQDRFMSIRGLQMAPQQHLFERNALDLGEKEESHPMEQDMAVSEKSSKQKKKKKGIKVNDTKNITKNFSKAIISYITQSKDLGVKMMEPERFDEFLTMLKSMKNNMTNIKHLRDLWVDDPERRDFNRAFRVFSSYFIKCQSVPYIYNSRIANTGWHLKYRYNLLRALREPENFKYIKDI